MTDHYLTMLLDCGAKPEEVKAQWKKLASELHPDKLPQGKPKILEAATQRFAALSGAYAVLSDPKARAAFDFEREIGRSPCHACFGRGRTTKSKGFTARVSTPCNQCGGSGLKGGFQ